MHPFTPDPFWTNGGHCVGIREIEEGKPISNYTIFFVKIHLQVVAPMVLIDRYGHGSRFRARIWKSPQTGGVSAGPSFWDSRLKYLA
jgi:hypothetical protein